MAVPILYVEAFPDVATDHHSPVNVYADDGTNQHQALLTTVGGMKTLSVTVNGSGLIAGTYTNVPLAGANRSGSLTVVVNADGTVHAAGATPFAPGFGFANGAGVTPDLSLMGTPSSVTPVFQVASVVPCTTPFPPGTQYVEISCDANGPAAFVFDSTLSSTGLTNGILTTQQATFTTAFSRIQANERLVRRVPAYGVPYLGTSPLTLQVIMNPATVT